MRIAWVCGILSALAATTAFAQAANFPQPDSLKPAIEFWIDVYTEADTSSGYLHDNLHLDIVYEKLQFRENASSRDRRRVTDAARKKYRDILAKLRRGNFSNLSDEEQRVLDLFPEDVSAAELRSAAERIRFQLGQANRFREGLERSGRWKPHILEVLASHNLPLELAAMPHVESSFNPTAYSRVGAAGLWQFTRSTGLRYMTIDHIVDERRDPYESTYAAARLLEDNFAITNSWPLAITAYNHGVAGMRRAINQLNTRDIGRVVAEYNGRTFGFASRNFYAAFVAALTIDRNPEAYFSNLVVDTPESIDLVENPDYITVTTLAQATGLSESELKRLNPALMETVWEGDKFVPRGFMLRLPGNTNSSYSDSLSSIATTERYANQRPDLHHRVGRGDTLSQIADRYNVSLAALVRANGLRSRNFIRIGQVLTLPVASGETPPTLAALSSPQGSGIGGAQSGEYIVRRGDTLATIARRYGVSTSALMQANQVANANRIFIGQQLHIPSTEEATTAALDTLVASETQTSEPALALLQPVIVNRSLIEPVFADLETSNETRTEPLLSTALAADPSDYSVNTNDTIEVQALETLGHYADWLGIPTQRLRDINSIPFGQTVRYSQRIRLDFSVVDQATFEQRRIAYQQSQQESFFVDYRIDDVTDHVVKTGESLWILANRQYGVPVWLLRQYNPNVNLDRINPGMVVKFPLLSPVEKEDT